MALVVVHEFWALSQLDLKEQTHAEDQHAGHYGEPVHEPDRLGELHPLLQVELDRHQSHFSSCDASSPVKKKVDEDLEQQEL